MIEIAYIVATNDNELFHYHLKSLTGEFQLWKVAVLVCLVLFTAALYGIAHKLRLNIALFICTVLLLLFIYVNHKLEQNLILTDKTCSINDALSRMKTGDYILYRTPQTLQTVFDIIPVTFLGIYHLGVVVKDEHGTFILETMPYKYYCEYSKKEKYGVVLLDAKKRLEESIETAYFVENNLKPHIDKTKVYEFIDIYKDYKYMEKNVNCDTLTLLFLEYFDLIHKDISQHLLFLPYNYLLKAKNYTVDFQYTIYKLV
jgi:hypothetical protein